MQAQGLEWGESYRALGRDALASILRGQMGHAIDEHLDRMAALDQADRRNGSYRRHLLTELGAIELAVPRTRRSAPIGVLRAYARRPQHIDRMILWCFVLGMSGRKVSEALLPILGRPISPATVSTATVSPATVSTATVSPATVSTATVSTATVSTATVSTATVSTVAKQLDVVVAAFHARPLQDRYRVLMRDGVVLARETGAGAIRRPVLVALGLRADGKKEDIDFRLAQSESAAEWERFLGDLIRRGLVGDRFEMICVDGGAGLLAALPTAYPGVPVQRCWAHKIGNVLNRNVLNRNVLNKVRVADQPAVKTDLHAVMNAATLPRSPVQRPAVSPTAGRRIIHRLSLACVTTSMISLLAGAINPSPSAKLSEPPTPSNGAFAKLDDAPGRWACFPTEPRWTASGSQSSVTKTKTRASAPLSC